MLPVLDKLTRTIKKEKHDNCDDDDDTTDQNGNEYNKLDERIDDVNIGQISQNDSQTNPQTNPQNNPQNNPQSNPQKTKQLQKTLQTNQTQSISATSLSSPLTKMIIGMCLAAIAYVCAALVDMGINNAAKDLDPVTQLPTKISILWQIPQYFWITMAEVFISVTGLYFVFDMSPNNMKSLVTALYLFSGALGDFLTSFFYNIFQSWNFSRLQMFIAFAVCILINSIGIIVIQRVYGKLYKFK
jgi:hypothetical protein